MKLFSRFLLCLGLAAAVSFVSCNKESEMDSVGNIVEVSIYDDFVSTKCSFSESLQVCPAANWVVMLYENGNAVRNIGDEYSYPMVFFGKAPQVFLYADRTYDIYVLANVPASDEDDLQAKADAYWSEGNSFNLSKALSFSYDGSYDYSAIKKFGYAPRASTTKSFRYSSGSKIEIPVPLVHQVSLSVSKDRDDIKVVSGRLFRMADKVFPFTNNHLSYVPGGTSSFLTNDEVDYLNNNSGPVSLWCLENLAGNVSSVSSISQRIPDVIGSLANRATYLELNVDVGDYSAFPNGIATIRFFLGEGGDFTSFNCVRNKNTDLLLNLNSDKLSVGNPSSWLIEKGYDKQLFKLEGKSVFVEGETIAFQINSNVDDLMVCAPDNEEYNYNFTSVGNGLWKLVVDPLEPGEYRVDFIHMTDALTSTGSDCYTHNFTVVKNDPGSSGGDDPLGPDITFVGSPVTRDVLVAEKLVFEATQAIGDIEFATGDMPYEISGNTVTMSMTKAASVKFRVLNSKKQKSSYWMTFKVVVPELIVGSLEGNSVVGGNYDYTLFGSVSNSSIINMRYGQTISDSVVLPLSGNSVSLLYSYNNRVYLYDYFDRDLYEQYLAVKSVSNVSGSYTDLSSVVGFSRYDERAGFKLFLKDVVSIPYSTCRISLNRGIGSKNLVVGIHAPVVSSMSNEIENRYLFNTGTAFYDYEIGHPLLNSGLSIDKMYYDGSLDNMSISIDQSNSFINGIKFGFNNEGRGTFTLQFKITNKYSNKYRIFERPITCWFCEGFALYHPEYFKDGSASYLCPVLINYHDRQKVHMRNEDLNGGVLVWDTSSETVSQMVKDKKIIDIGPRTLAKDTPLYRTLFSTAMNRIYVTHIPIYGDVKNADCFNVWNDPFIAVDMSGNYGLLDYSNSTHKYYCDLAAANLKIGLGSHYESGADWLKATGTAASVMMATWGFMGIMALIGSNVNVYTPDYTRSLPASYIDSSVHSDLPSFTRYYNFITNPLP